ncbi:MAG: AAA family ATPase [Oscillospiraceae bacterium]|nr:AAA family ATPase [Oscillospiraceae bacterium]
MNINDDEFYDSGLFIEKMTIDWKKIDRHSYLRSITPIRKLSEFVFRSRITIFTGENGSGKSTLLEAMAIRCGFNPEGGTFNYDFSTYDSHSELYEAMRATRSYRRPEWGMFLRAESFYNVATMEEEYARRDPFTISHEYHKKSHGESFLQTLSDNFQPDGLFFLDEPEAALSPQNQMALLVMLHDCSKSGSQIIMATHSPILMSVPGADIYSFDPDGIHPCRYTETQSYIITKKFVNDHENMLKKLLSDDE